jgi:hypothetical protein
MSAQTRFFVVRANDETTVEQLFELGSYVGVEVVEIVPEKRDSTWFERATVNAIVEKLP